MNKTPNTNDVPTPLNPIRVETALSRYPVHRLAKHGDIAIDIREKNQNGEVSIKWEVNHVSKFGQPALWPTSSTRSSSTGESKKRPGQSPGSSDWEA